MIVIVKTPEEGYKYCKEHAENGTATLGEILIACGLPLDLPDKPTNGDVVLSLWNGTVKLISERQNLVVAKFGEKIRCFQLDWWNAPFKENKDGV